MTNALPARVRFGDFQLDLRAGELRQGEQTILLQEQPFRLLLMLVAHNGEIATREDIQKNLWPNDTVVEFDKSITAAIKRLRKALGDSAEQPKYIETVARRGYRLMLPVERVAAAAGDELSCAPEETALRSTLSSTSRTGKTVSHYRVLEILGGGGMGVVYRAEDLKLGRAVALKFLPEELGDDPKALERFEREARAASALDHPNICSIYEFGEHEGQPFIVMQLLEGQTVREHLASLALQKSNSDGSCPQAFPLDQLLDAATQVANGLQTAHERGIIHRDIKPANIFLTTRGLVKILDFGVAKLVEAGDSQQAAAASQAQHGNLARELQGEATGCHPTNGLVSGHDFSRAVSLPSSDSIGLQPATASHLTRTGSAMGTAGYMSPEQVRGEKVDARTDLFSFGLVLYEMATGQRAFGGDTAAIVRQAILTQTPPPAHEVNSTIPPKLEAIVNRAIEKDREHRYQSAAEMRADLQAVAVESSGADRGRSDARTGWKWLATAAIVCVAMLAGSSYWYRRSHRAPKLTDKDTIVIADFDNKTGDPVFDDTLKQAVSIQLEQSPFLNVLSERKVAGTLKLMNRSKSERLTEDVARDVCLRTGSKAIVLGSIAASGSRYGIGIKTVDCNTGDLLAEVQERAADKQAVLRALDTAATSLRSKLGESLSSVEKYATPQEEATTPSLEALKAYSLGRKTNLTKGGMAALPFLKRAVELDPNFAMPYAAMSLDYSNMTEVGRAAESARKAYELRAKVSERERLFIEAIYYQNATGELEKSAQTYEKWQEIYPRDYIPYANASFIYSTLGQDPEKALKADREALRLEPNYVTHYINLGWDYMVLNRLEEAETVFKQAEERKLESGNLLLNRYSLAFLKDDTEQMAQLVSAAAGKPGIEDVLLSAQAETEAWHGKLKHARELTRRAMVLAQRNDANETAALYGVSSALFEVEMGDRARARAEADAAVKLAPNRDVRAMAAVALVRAGDTEAGEKLADELNKQFPLNTLMQRYWLPTIGAAVALQHKDSKNAVKLLQTASLIELSQPNDTARLCPVYLRGEAFLMQHDGQAAAAEFQKFIDHYGLVMSFPWGALARLGLARAYALEAATDPAARDKARTAYQNFLTLWKDADPNIPIYKQAKAEYAKLQ